MGLWVGSSSKHESLLLQPLLEVSNLTMSLDATYLGEALHQQKSAMQNASFISQKLSLVPSSNYSRNLTIRIHRD